MQQLQEQVKYLKARQAKNLSQIEHLRSKLQEQQKSHCFDKQKMKQNQQQMQKIRQQNQKLRYIILVEKKLLKNVNQLKQKLINIGLTSVKQQKYHQSAPLNPYNSYNYHAAPSAYQLVHIKRITNKQSHKDAKKFKICFLGGVNSGKTSIIQRFVRQMWMGDQYKPTIGIDFLSILGQLNDQPFKLMLWDTAGQERFRSLIPNYIKDSAALVFVFDLTDPQSFKQLSDVWLPIANQYANANFSRFLIGNKSDISKNVIQQKQIHAFAEKHDLNFRAVSAKNNKEIQQMFSLIASSLLKQ